MIPVDDGEPGTLTDVYAILAQEAGYRVNPNNTTTPIMTITARSKRYDVTFSFNMTKTSYDASGAPQAAYLKTTQVDQIAGHEHVVGVHGEEDHGNDGNLYNFLVVTVGTADGERTDDVRIRMDAIGTPAAFGKIDRAWQLIAELGGV